MHSDLVMRPFEEGDLNGVLKLLRRCLGESPEYPRSEQWFRWRHFENPFGRSLLLVAEVHDRIVGLRALLLWELLTPDGQLLKCGRPVDTAIDPDFRRSGIFRRLTLAGVEMARDTGIQLLFNTPNARSGAGYLSMGWTRIGSVGAMLRPKLGILRGASRVPGKPEEIPDSQLALPVAMPDRTPLGLRTPRSDAYQRWRYEANPNSSYLQVADPNGTVIARPNLRGGRREMVVSEIYGDAVNPLRRIARLTTAQYLVGWFSRGSPERRVAIRGGLVPVPLARPLTLMARPLEEIPFDIERFSNWDLSLGDLELL